MRPPFFWDVMQLRLPVSYGRFGITSSKTTNLRFVTSQKSKDLIYAAAEMSNHAEVS